MKRAWFMVGCLLFTGFVADSATCLAQDYTFNWTANEEPVDGYKLYYKKGGTATAPFDGTEAGDGPSPITLGNVTTYTITGLDANAIYHFTLTAFIGTEESGYSSIITINPTEAVSALPIPQLLDIHYVQ
nr:fibronectin type III domain-containing protein [uncultured Desulfobulbus sp.]